MYLIKTTWPMAILCHWAGGGGGGEGVCVLLKGVFVQVIWKYRTGLRKDGGVWTELSAC